MTDFRQKKILAARLSEDFIGRSSELEHLLRQAEGEEGLLLVSAPGSGASELLRQCYDRLFHSPTDIIPFYFALDKKDTTAHQTALSFLQQFLLQTVAFRRRDPKMLEASPDISEIAEQAIPSDGYWIDRLIEACGSDRGFGSERTLIRNCLSAPLRAAANGARVFAMVDDLHESLSFEDGSNLFSELKDVFGRSKVPFVFAGKRRFLFGTMGCETISLGQLPFPDVQILVDNLAATNKIEVNEQTRDLIATQFQGNPAFINFLFQSAREKNVELTSFQNAQQIYADEIFGGRISKVYDVLLAGIAPSVEAERVILSLLYDALTLGNKSLPVESWQKRLGMPDAEFSRLINLLNVHEVVRLSSNRVEAMTENEVLMDYVAARFRLELVGETRALVVGETLSGLIKRAPQTMAKFYRRSMAIGIRALMEAFKSQEIPLALIDYGKFADEYKGAPNEEILRDLRRASDRLTLPHIVYTAHTTAVYKPIELVSVKERSAIALGFQEGRFTDEDEIVWIAAEIDSKLEAAKALTEFWCDRLEMVALVCNFANFKVWLIAPEGFSPEAIEVLRQRNSFGSSRKQLELLAQSLNAETPARVKSKAEEYEIVVPMSDEAELIAAHAVEEIARRHHFAAKAINQIKTALVEACINASEHSLSPDRKIYQKFTVEDDRIIITISNRGMRLSDKRAVEVEPGDGRRGWGLKLMRKLMDEVKIEQTDDGTRISMTKFLKPA